MILEITGAWFNNLGAHLMLATVCERVRLAIPGARLCMTMTYDDSTEQRAQYGVEFCLGRPRHWGNPRLIPRYLISSLASRISLGAANDLIHESEIDGVLDISGFAFGDKWRVRPINRFARRAATYKRRDKPVIMLPQMLGPFARPGRADAFKHLAENVDIIFAREEESFRYTERLVPNGKLRLAPDITITAEAKHAVTPGRPYVCLVVNSRLLEINPGQPAWGDEYVKRLARTAEHALQRGMSVFIVKHELAQSDQRLAQLLHTTIGKDRCGIYEHADPFVVKSFLGGAHLVIGSRFHALVSSLSMGTPVIALGWAHKYGALLEDFGISFANHHRDEPAEHLTSLVDRILETREDVIAVILKNKLRMSKENEVMWRIVFEALGHPQEASQPKA